MMFAENPKVHIFVARVPEGRLQTEEGLSKTSGKKFQFECDASECALVYEGWAKAEICPYTTASRSG